MRATATPPPSLQPTGNQNWMSLPLSPETRSLAAHPPPPTHGRERRARARQSIPSFPHLISLLAVFTESAGAAFVWNGTKPYVPMLCYAPWPSHIHAHPTCNKADLLDRCDFCHVNHQPCDNAKPRCSYCERHNKSCLYLRPQKKRGPAQGYRSALHTLRESAAAWGAALNLIPSLGPVVEGYLKQPEGRRLVQAIKDPAQQEFFIQAWQQSGVFKTFFPDEASSADQPSATSDGPASASLPNAAPSMPLQQQQPQQHLTLASHPNPLASASGAVISPPRPPVPQLSQTPHFDTLSMPKIDNNPFGFVPTPSPSSQDGSSSRPRQPSGTHRNKPRQESISLSDIVAKDAARSYVNNVPRRLMVYN